MTTHSSELHDASDCAENFATTAAMAAVALHQVPDEELLKQTAKHFSAPHVADVKSATAATVTRHPSASLHDDVVSAIIPAIEVFAAHKNVAVAAHEFESLAQHALKNISRKTLRLVLAGNATAMKKIHVAIDHALDVQGAANLMAALIAAEGREVPDAATLFYMGEASVKAQFANDKAPVMFIWLAEAVNDPATKLAAARAQEARTNVSGAPLPDSALALLGIRRMTHGRTSDGDREGRASGARFDGIGSPTDYNSQAGQAFMRSYAMEKGVTWAANNSDILRLGPAGIDILAQTKLREETFNRLTDAGLSSKGSVGVAAMIHAQGGDANEGGKAVAESLKAMDDRAVTDAVNARATLQVPDKNETPQQKQAREAKISDADARVEGAVGEHIKHHPEHAGHGKKLMKTLGVKLKANEATTEALANKTVATATQVATKTSDLDAFNAPEPSKPSSVAPQKQVDHKKIDDPKTRPAVSRPKQQAPSQ